MTKPAPSMIPTLNRWQTSESFESALLVALPAQRDVAGIPA